MQKSQFVVNTHNLEHVSITIPINEGFNVNKYLNKYI